MAFPASLAALTATAAASAALAIRGHYGGPRRTLVYVFKPLTTLLLLAVALRPSEARGSRYAVAVALGLAFSLAGDVFLMLPKDRFRAGLSSFLAAHLCYLAAFTAGTGLLVRPFPAVAFGAFGLLLLRSLWPGVPARLRVPVALYVAVLLAMAVQAAGRAADLREASSLLAGAGAALFVVSDALLAWDRFRTPFRASRAVVLSTYFLAQWLIALSVPAGATP
ncbi:MAG TPA: lysoplasmalogenase [Thermoanaerobaculia bacterium]|nr:lysoplasmalogenase [Thermoanaerobaculia bacterium]HQR66593.1 lysoplasmalogenase [Thermoanaerobaculia bacterium]